MCRHPRYIAVPVRMLRNRSITHHVYVGCGNCDQCYKERQNGYMIRNFFESLRTFQKGGFVFLDTLTYNDEHLSHFYLASDVPPTDVPNVLFVDKSSQGHYIYRINTYKYDDVRSFWNRLRKFINRKLGLDCRHSLRYMSVPELGKNHLRPHYHLTFYSTVPGLSVDMLKRAINHVWRGIDFNALQPSDGCNFVCASDVDIGATNPYDMTLYNQIVDITNMAHIRYSTKYVLKNTYVVNQLLKLFHCKYVQELPKELREYIRCSRNFGYFDDVDCRDELYYKYRLSNYVDVLNDKVLLPYTGVDQFQLQGDKVAYPYPQFYNRKFYYDTVKMRDGTYCQLPNGHYFLEYLSREKQRLQQTKNSLWKDIQIITNYFPFLRNELDSVNLDNLAWYRLYKFGRVVHVSGLSKQDCQD